MVRDLNHFDVAIVGGGLAGLMRADVLADALANDPSLDLRVAIIDPEQMPSGARHLRRGV